MSYGEIAQAMLGITSGVKQARAEARTGQVEDENFRRQQAENDHFEAMAPLDVANARNRNRITNTQADIAEGTQDGQIEATNTQNTDTIAKYRSRLDNGVPQAEALAQLTDAERAVVEDHLATSRANELIDQGAPEAEARAQVAGSNASTASSNRSQANDEHAAKIGLDRTKNWAEQSEAAFAATTARRGREDIETDELNGVFAEQAVARKQAAQSARRMEEINLKLTKARQKSGFDMTQFARENAEGIMQAASDATTMARIGGEAAAAALPLINMDADGDGNLDFPGAVTTGIQNINGEEYLVALDDQGQIVESTVASGIPGMKVADINQFTESTAKNKAKKNGTASKTTPVKLSDIDDLDDLSYDMLGASFGANMVDTDDDGVADTFATMSGVVPTDFEDEADTLMPTIQNHLGGYLAVVQRNGGSIAEARAAISSPEDMARNIYGANDADIEMATKYATKNAKTREAERQRAEGTTVTNIDEVVPDPTVVQEELNKLMIKMMSQSNPNL